MLQIRNKRQTRKCHRNLRQKGCWYVLIESPRDRNELHRRDSGIFLVYVGGFTNKKLIYVWYFWCTLCSFRKNHVSTRTTLCSATPKQPHHSTDSQRGVMQTIQKPMDQGVYVQKIEHSAEHGLLQMRQRNPARKFTLTEILRNKNAKKNRKRFEDAKRGRQNDKEIQRNHPFCIG